MRRLTDREILARAVNQWHEHGHVDDDLGRSAGSTARFLWLVAALTALALCATWVWEAYYRGEENSHDCPGAGAQVECPQGDEGGANRKGEDSGVRHAVHSANPSGTTATMKHDPLRGVP